MKKIILLFVVCLPFISLAQSNSLSGKWREVNRTDLKSKDLDFKDTIKLDFLPGNEYTWMKKGGFIYRGTYKIENGALDMGARYFKIVKRNSDKLVLSDDEATYVFEPYQEAKIPTLPPDAQPAQVTSVGQITGKWKVFKGTSSKTIKELDLANRIKLVVIYDRPDKDGNVGAIAGGNDSKDQPSWKINKLENGILYCNGKSVRLLEASQTAKQLILKEDGMTYFLKQFND